MLNQMIVYQWFRQYDVDAHIEKIRGIYRKKLHYHLIYFRIAYKKPL